MRYRKAVEITYLVLGVVGAAIGSFLNVVILRSQYVRSHVPMPGLPAKASAKAGRSRCPACGHSLSAFELIPVLSWVLQAGRCRHCRVPISLQYPLVEIATGLLAVFLLAPPLINPLLSPLSQGGLTLALLDFIAVALLIVLFCIDRKTFLLPDKFIWPLAAVVVVHASIRVTSNQLPVTAPLGGAAVGAGFLLLLYLATRGRGIGFGDVKLMIPLGLRFSVLGTMTLLFMAFMAGGAYGSVLLATRRATMKTAIPFGPFLIGAALLLMVMPNLPQQLLALLGWPV